MKLDGINEEIIRKFSLSGVYRYMFEALDVYVDIKYKNGEIVNEIR